MQPEAIARSHRPTISISRHHQLDDPLKYKPLVGGIAASGAPLGQARARVGGQRHGDAFDELRDRNRQRQAGIGERAREHLDAAAHVVLFPSSRECEVMSVPIDSLAWRHRRLRAKNQMLHRVL